MHRITIDCTPAQLAAWVSHMTTLNDSTLNPLNAMLKPYVAVSLGGTGTSRPLFDIDTNKNVS